MALCPLCPLCPIVTLYTKVIEYICYMGKQHKRVDKYCTYWEEHGPWTYQGVIDLCQVVHDNPQCDVNPTDVIIEHIDKLSLDDFRRLLAEADAGNPLIESACGCCYIFSSLPVTTFNRERLNVCHEFKQHFDVGEIMSSLDPEWPDLIDIILMLQDEDV